MQKEIIRLNSELKAAKSLIEMIKQTPDLDQWIWVLLGETEEWKQTSKFDDSEIKKALLE